MVKYSLTRLYDFITLACFEHDSSNKPCVSINDTFFCRYPHGALPHFLLGSWRMIIILWIILFFEQVRATLKLAAGLCFRRRFRSGESVFKTSPPKVRLQNMSTRRRQNLSEIVFRTCSVPSESTDELRLRRQ